MIKRTRPYRTQRIVEKGKSKLITTIDNRFIWDLVKEYINAFPLGDIISRSTLISSIYHIKKNYIYLPTVDNYIYNLEAVNILEEFDSGEYKKLRNIPINLTTSQLSKISNKNSWESWFMSIDYV